WGFGGEGVSSCGTFLGACGVEFEGCHPVGSIKIAGSVTAQAGTSRGGVERACAVTKERRPPERRVMGTGREVLQRPCPEFRILGSNWADTCDRNDRSDYEKAKRRVHSLHCASSTIGKKNAAA